MVGQISECKKPFLAEGIETIDSVMEAKTPRILLHSKCNTAQKFVLLKGLKVYIMSDNDHSAVGQKAAKSLAQT